MESATLTPERAQEQNAALDDARDRLRTETPQLSFDLGAGLRAAPDFGSLKIGGDLNLPQDLKRRQSLVVTVTDPASGEVLATSPATVTGIAFKDKTDSHGITTTDRVHTATLD